MAYFEEDHFSGGDHRIARHGWRGVRPHLLACKRGLSAGCCKRVL